MYPLSQLTFLLFVLLALFEKIWKYFQVKNFLHRSVPKSTLPLPSVSILQAILSGDPTLSECLEANLRQKTQYPIEFIWLVDEDDGEGLEICSQLANRNTKVAIRIVSAPVPDPNQNPKMVKLIAGAKIAHGEIICVLDDDTRIPDFGLEQCLLSLDQSNAGLAFGLPYYLSFQNTWSRLVAYFVNSHSLMTYIPYLRLIDPVTINGMFYAIRRDTLEAIGGFTGLEDTLADDFAIAQRIRQHGYKLIQTPLRHGISTYVTGPRHYFSLIQRWFIFPRESLMRHLQPYQLLIMYGLALLPMYIPWLALIWLPFISPILVFNFLSIYMTVHYLIFAQINRSYLGSASPWRWSWWVPILQWLLPVQLLAALFSPQRILWRGHLIQAQKGGELHIVQRRSNTPVNNRDTSGK